MIMEDSIKAVYEAVQAARSPPLFRRWSGCALTLGLLGTTQHEGASETTAVVIGWSTPKLEPGTVDVHLVEPQQPTCVRVELGRTQRITGSAGSSSADRPGRQCGDRFGLCQLELAEGYLMATIGPLRRREQLGSQR